MKSILQFSLLDSIEIEGFLTYVKGRLFNRVTEAKLKSPNADYSEQDKVIEYVEKSIEYMNKIYHGNIFLLKESQKAANIITDLENNIWRQQQIIEAQNKEIENLKQNLPI
jgi:DNA integrity scanning protein DisA with diadenylate cyclase activity